MMEDDFLREHINDVLIEKVNITRATIKEAGIFKERLFAVVLMGQKKIIIDLSECNFIDSTFLGALVIILKRISEKGGELKIVQPKTQAVALIKQIGLYRVFNLYNTTSDALKSF